MVTSRSNSANSSNPPAALHQPLRGFPGWLILLGVLTAVGSLSIDMYLPAFPAVVAALHTDPSAVQRTLSMFFIGFGLGQLIYGPLSDRFGRRPLLLVGMTIYTVASLACMFAPNIYVLQWSRLLQALGGCAGIIIPRAAIRDRCDPRSAARALSLIMLVVGAAPILAPQLGSWILIWFSWRLIFGVLMLFGAVSLIAVFFGMEETVDRTTTQKLKIHVICRNYYELLRDRQFLTFSLCGGFAAAGMFAYIAESPFVLMQLYSLPAHTFSWVFGVNAMGLVICSQINARLLAFYQPRTILALAVFVPFLAGTVLLVLRLLNVAGLPILLPALFFSVACLGFISANCTALALQHQGARAGAATALMGAMQFGLATVSSTVIGLWHVQNELPFAAIMAICGGGALLMFRFAPSAQTAS
jgi:MFS transporter, DHA1 family, multidrug resistance protein